LPNNQRQRCTCYALCHALYPVSAAHTSIFRVDSNSTPYRSASNVLCVEPRFTQREQGVPHGGLRPFHQWSNCITQLTLGPYVVQIWSHNTLKFWGNKPRVLHRLGTNVNATYRSHFPPQPHTRGSHAKPHPFWFDVCVMPVWFDVCVMPCWFGVCVMPF